MTGKTRGAVGLDSSLEEGGLKGRQRMSSAGENGGLEAPPEHQPLLAGVSGGQDTFAQGSRMTPGQGLSIAQEEQALGWLWCSQAARAVGSLGAAVDRSGVGETCCREHPGTWQSRWVGGVSMAAAGSPSSGIMSLHAGGSGPQQSGEVELGEEGGDGKVGLPGAWERELGGAVVGVRSCSSPGLASTGSPCT